MPRIGVEYDDVVDVAEELCQTGTNVTVEAIRRHLGTGSNSTLAKHLKRYKEEQRPLHVSFEMPNLLSQQVQRLYQQLEESAETKTYSIALMSQALIIHQQEEIAKLRLNNRRWQNLHDRWTEEKVKLTSQVNNLIAEQIIQEDNIQALKIERDLLAEISIEQKCHNESLTRQLIHAQQNLEHFRESAREQLLSEQNKNKEIFPSLEKLIIHQISTLLEASKQIKGSDEIIKNEINTITTNQEILCNNMNNTNEMVLAIQRSITGLVSVLSERKSIDKSKKTKNFII